MNQRIHFKPSWSVQQILSHPKKLILSIDGSFSTHYAKLVVLCKEWNRLWNVCGMNFLPLFDGVAINESRFTQQQITTL